MWGFPHQALPYVSGTPPIERIRHGSESAVSELALTDLPAGFFEYWLLFKELLPASAGSNLFINTSTDNGSTWDQGAADYRYTTAGHQHDSATFQRVGNDGSTRIQVNHPRTHGAAAGDEAVGTIICHNARDSGQHTKFSGNMVWRGATTWCSTEFAGARKAAQDVNAFRLFFSASVNIATVKYQLLGVRAS